MWLKQHRSGVVAGFGLALIVMAVAIPVVTPMAERSDVLIMTLLFSLVGAGMIYMAVSERRTVTPQPDTDREIAAGRTARNSLGLAFSAFITAAGAAAPFIFPDVGPDERFAMMVGFAPVAIAGGVLTYVFWRALRPAAGEGIAGPAVPAPAPRRTGGDRSATARRAPVARVPRTALYGRLVPISIAVMLVAIALIVLFLALVVATAILPLL